MRAVIVLVLLFAGWLMLGVPVGVLVGRCCASPPTVDEVDEP